jgi:hypothetical protein
MSDDGGFECLIPSNVIIHANQHASGAMKGLEIRPWPQQWRNEAIPKPLDEAREVAEAIQALFGRAGPLDLKMEFHGWEPRLRPGPVRSRRAAFVDRGQLNELSREYELTGSPKKGCG